MVHLERVHFILCNLYLNNKNRMEGQDKERERAREEEGAFLLLKEHGLGLPHMS